MTLLELLKTKMAMPTDVWDYKIFHPFMDDEAVLSIWLYLDKKHLRIITLDLETGKVTSRNETKP